MIFSVKRWCMLGLCKNWTRECCISHVNISWWKSFQHVTGKILFVLLRRQVHLGERSSLWRVVGPCVALLLISKTDRLPLFYLLTRYHIIEIHATISLVRNIVQSVDFIPE